MAKAKDAMIVLYGEAKNSRFRNELKKSGNSELDELQPGITTVL